MTTETLPAIADKPIITIDPVQYVAEVCKPFVARFDAAKAEEASITYDITTAAGMATAIARRRVFWDLQIELEKERESRKAPIIKMGKLLDSRVKEVDADIEVYKEKHAAKIKAQEKIKEDERQAKIKAEQERVEKIQSNIRDLSGAIGMAARYNLTAAALSEHIADLEGVAVDDTFAEFKAQAENVKANTLVTLREMLATATEREAEAQRLKDEREQLEREKAEQKRLDDEAKAKRDAEEARLQAARDKLLADQRRAAANAKAEADRVRDEQAEAQAVIDDAAAELQREREEWQANLDAKTAAAAADSLRQREAEEAAKPKENRFYREAPKPEPVSDRDPAIDGMTAKGREAWADVPYATAYVEELRGNDPPKPVAAAIRVTHINSPTAVNLLRAIYIGRPSACIDLVSEHYALPSSTAMAWLEAATEIANAPTENANV